MVGSNPIRTVRRLWLGPRVVAVLVGLAGLARSADAASNTEGGAGFAGLDLETVYLGFDPVLPGSEAQIDFRLADRLLRFTAWTDRPDNRFDDFHIDLAVDQVPSVQWVRITTAVADRLVFTYEMPEQNVKLYGDFLLAPHWRGVLDTAPIIPALPMDNMPFTGPVRWLMVRAPRVEDPAVPVGPYLMPYGVYETVTPTISIPVGLVTSSNGTVELDDGWDETGDAVDITNQFVPTGSEAIATNVAFRYGSNRLTFRFAQGEFEVYSLNYDADHRELIEDLGGNDEDDDYLEITGDDAFLRVLINGLGILAPPSQADVDSSSFLRIFRLRPTGFADELEYFQAFVHGQDLSDDENSNTLPDILEYFNEDPKDDPRQSVIVAELAWETLAASESVQASIANTNVMFGYNLVTHGWNDPAGVFSGLDRAREHFWMDSFAGHRLIAKYVSGVVGPENQPVIAVADTGFGTLSTPNADLPLGAFREIWLIPEDSNACPELINSDARGDRIPVTNAHVMNPKTRDTTTATGHGTAVTFFAAGRGATQKLGTGPNSLVSVYKVKGRLSQGYYVVAAHKMAADEQVRVANFSSGATLRYKVGTPPAVVALLRSQQRKFDENLFDFLARKGIIAVAAGGNDDELPNEDSPGHATPSRGNRDTAMDDYPTTVDGMSPLSMRIGGFVPPDDAAVPESHWNPIGGAGSGTGNNIDVVAHAMNIDFVDPTLSLLAGDINALSGTSWSAPIVAGLVAEVLRILDLREGDEEPKSVVQRAGRADRAKQAVEIVEATADRLGRNPAGAGNFAAAETAANNTQGFGRINVWKAALTAINGGLAEGGTVKNFGAPAAPNEFATLDNAIDANETTWYGFLIRLQSNHLDAAGRFNNATVWINDNPYDDAVNPADKLAAQVSDADANTEFTAADGGADTNNVIAYKRQASLNSRTPAGFPIVGGGATGMGVQEMVFSATKDEVDKDVGNKRLELREDGQANTDQPFFSIPLDIAKLRNNDTVGAGGNGTNIRFDDFVFEILVDHTVAVSPNEVVVGAGAGALPGVN